VYPEFELLRCQKLSNGRLRWTLSRGATENFLKINYIYFELILVMIIRIGLLKYYRFVGLFRYIFLVNYEGFAAF
jgi:hypothetical protein